MKKIEELKVIKRISSPWQER